MDQKSQWLKLNSTNVNPFEHKTMAQNYLSASSGRFSHRTLDNTPAKNKKVRRGFKSPGVSLTHNDDAEQSFESVYLDTFILKIFAILFCRGTTEQKAIHLFDVIIGPNGRAINKNEVQWRSKRMIRAFKYLVYFSDIFPKKYWKEFMELPCTSLKLLSP